MKKIVSVVFIFCLVAGSAFYSKVALAATTDVTGGTNGPLCNSGGYFTPSSVTVSSGDTITFSVPSNDPYAGGIQINGFPQGSFVVPRGGSITTDPLTANVSYQGTWPNSLSCIKGSGTVAVQASSPSPSPTPTPTPSPSPSPSPSPTPNSTNSTPSTTIPSSTSTEKPSTPTSTPVISSSQSVTAPVTVVADTIAVNGRTVTSRGNLSIQQSQSLTLSGTTVAHGRITFTIHSHPTTAVVQADASGTWSYTISGLQPGNHTIQATVTDPATNQTSSLATLLSFSVTASSEAGSARPSTPAKHSSLLLALMSSVVLLGLIVTAIVTVLLMKKSKTKLPASATDQTS